MDVTATVSTKDRYFSTLPMLLTAVASQSRLPEKLIIFDDGEQRDLREDALYKSLFALLQHKVPWEVVFGARKGQVANHQKALETAKTELIWRLDDDQSPEPDVLERLLEVMETDPKIGAVAGLIIDPKSGVGESRVASSKIEDIYLGLNEQWFLRPAGAVPFEADHLYSSFLYRRAATKGYPAFMSPVGHREETIFTHEMKRAGWRLLIQPACVTWHFHFPTGGIRSWRKKEFWAEDEHRFDRLLRDEWGVTPRETRLFVLNSGMGDHIVFRHEVLPLLREKHKGKRIVLANCYPEVFEDDADILDISIGEARMIEPDMDSHDVYKWAVDHGWKGNLWDAHKAMLGVGKWS